MSSTISGLGYNYFPSSCSLDGVEKEKPKLLTVKFELDTLAEFAATAELNRARTVSEFVHRFAVRVIEEAKKKVDPATFEELFLKKRQEIEERSAKKSEERKQSFSNGKERKPARVRKRKGTPGEEQEGKKPRKSKQA